VDIALLQFENAGNSSAAGNASFPGTTGEGAGFAESLGEALGTSSSTTDVMGKTPPAIDKNDASVNPNAQTANPSLAAFFSALAIAARSNSQDAPPAGTSEGDWEAKINQTGRRRGGAWPAAAKQQLNKDEKTKQTLPMVSSTGVISSVPAMTGLSSESKPSSASMLASVETSLFFPHTGRGWRTSPAVAAETGGLQNSSITLGEAKGVNKGITPQSETPALPVEFTEPTGAEEPESRAILRQEKEELSRGVQIGETPTRNQPKTSLAGPNGIAAGTNSSFGVKPYMPVEQSASLPDSANAPDEQKPQGGSSGAAVLVAPLLPSAGRESVAAPGQRRESAQGGVTEVKGSDKLKNVSVHRETSQPAGVASKAALESSFDLHEAGAGSAGVQASGQANFQVRGSGPANPANPGNLGNSINDVLHSASQHSQSSDARIDFRNEPPHNPSSGTMVDAHKASNDPASGSQGGKGDPQAGTQAGASSLAAATSAIAASPQPAAAANPPIAFPMHGHLPMAPASHAGPANASTSSAQDLPDGAEAPVLPPGRTGDVRSVGLINHADAVEMRVGMNTSAFGAVEVRTLVRDNQVGVAVGSERGDLHSYLAPEMLDLQNNLQPHELRLEQIRFLNGSNYLGGTLSGGAGGESRHDQAGQSHTFNWGRHEEMSPEIADILDIGIELPNGLSLHA
jgi:hypothetical protein